MRFSIINVWVRWLAWRRPQYRSAILGRSTRRARPAFLKKRNLGSSRPMRRLHRRRSFHSPEQLRELLVTLGVRLALTLACSWVLMEVYFSLFLLE
jgi:hypothetical protein